MSPAVLKGQNSGPTRESWTLGVAAGVFTYEPADDQSSPIFLVRMDRPASKWLRLEVATSFTRPEIQTDAGGIFDPSLPVIRTNLFTVTFGGQVRWTVGPLEPYAGVSVGFFGRRDRQPSSPSQTARSFGRSTFQFPFGIRIWATDHLGVRAEYRFDEDGHEAVSRSDNEMTAGLFWTF